MESKGKYRQSHPAHSLKMHAHKAHGQAWGPQLLQPIMAIKGR